MEKNNQRGITLVVLTITIIILMILAGITIHTGTESIQKANLEGLKTNMLLIETKAREYVENGRQDVQSYRSRHVSLVWCRKALEQLQEFFHRKIFGTNFKDSGFFFP